MSIHRSITLIGVALLWLPSARSEPKPKPPAISACRDGICITNLVWRRPAYSIRICASGRLWRKLTANAKGDCPNSLRGDETSKFGTGPRAIRRGLPTYFAAFRRFVQYAFILAAWAARCSAVKVRRPFFAGGGAETASGSFAGRPRRLTGPCKASVALLNLSRSEMSMAMM